MYNIKKTDTENEFKFVSKFGRCKDCVKFMSPCCTRGITTIYGGCSSDFEKVKKDGMIR